MLENAATRQCVWSPSSLALFTSLSRSTRHDLTSDRSPEAIYSCTLSTSSAAIVVFCHRKTSNMSCCDLKFHVVFGVCKTNHSAVHVLCLMYVSRKLLKTICKWYSHASMFGSPYHANLQWRMHQDPGSRLARRDAYRSSMEEMYRDAGLYTTMHA